MAVDLVVEEALIDPQCQGKCAHQRAAELLQRRIRGAEDLAVGRWRLRPDILGVELGSAGDMSEFGGAADEGADVELLAQIGGIVVAQRLGEVLRQQGMIAARGSALGWPR